MQRLDINFKLSRQFCGFYLALLLISLAIIVLLPLMLLAKSILMMAVTGYVFMIFRAQTRWRSLRHDATGWHIHYDGKEESVSLLGSSTVTHWISILRFAAENKRNCVIFKDMLQPDEYRRLILRARYFK